MLLMKYRLAKKLMGNQLFRVRGSYISENESDVSGDVNRVRACTRLYSRLNIL